MQNRHFNSYEQKNESPGKEISPRFDRFFDIIFNILDGIRA